uniref:HAT C-terminal dimerisation domain-containing protein n=1 Tax=Ditylenchus dipsaci TaxID=166011 RepID=A0A915EHD7_9BILA
MKQFGRVQSVIKEQLSHLPQRFSITCDVWTDSGLKNAYLGVTLHFVDADAVLQRIFLGLRQLEGSHTSHLIKRETEKLLQVYVKESRRLASGRQIMGPTSFKQSEGSVVSWNGSSQVLGVSDEHGNRGQSQSLYGGAFRPATSAPIERIFSQAGLATSKHRNRTEHELLNAQIVVYSYCHAEHSN